MTKISALSCICWEAYFKENKVKCVKIGPENSRGTWGAEGLLPQSERHSLSLSVGFPAILATYLHPSRGGTYVSGGAAMHCFSPESLKVLPQDMAL